MVHMMSTQTDSASYCWYLDDSMYGEVYGEIFDVLPKFSQPANLPDSFLREILMDSPNTAVVKTRFHWLVIVDGSIRKRILRLPGRTQKLLRVSFVRQIAVRSN